jgi:hypothetical protein
MVGNNRLGSYHSQSVLYDYADEHFPDIGQ